MGSIEAISRPPPTPQPAKIKVCHLAMGDLWAGAEVQLATLLTALARMPDFEVSAVLFNEGRLASELRDLGVSLQVIPEAHHHPISIVQQLVGYFRQHDIDILHTHKYKDNILGAVSSVYHGISRRVRTIHGFPEPFNGLPALRMSVYQLIDSLINRAFADHILAVSLDLRQHLIKRLGTEKVSCVHNAIDIDQIRRRVRRTDLEKELGLTRDDFVIGTMGRLTPVKGMDCFLRAARMIKGKGRDVKFIIAGDGPLNGSLQALARECKVEKDVLFLGHRTDAYDLLGLMHLFVLPSLSEGIPMVLLEALALARPVVATRVGGIPEVIEHGVSGLLIAPGREAEIAQSCLGLMDNYEFARGLGRAGRRRVEEHFSASAMAAEVAQVYRALVRGRED
jgi:glycosyltransferase involved in cell wall biosynthesis